ncbi:MAG: DNA primase [Asticcacaulis sp.]
MRFDDRFLEELKSRLRPSEVIGRSVRLRRQGREWVGLSPFSKEKTPSFYVNDEKGFYHDFSSGKHGDIISFLQEVERLSFVEAIEKLASEAGMALPAPDPRAQEVAARQQSLGDWLELAAKWFAAQLRRNGPGANAARAYLERRGLPVADWERFGLGYAPAERTGLKDALTQRGASVADLVEAGLLITPEGGGAPYDRFRDRIIFPITDHRGRIVSFGGRALNPDDKAKYLNGPETPLFHKGRTLYGLPEALKILGAAETGAALVVVEGYMDVIACQRASIAAVAPLGTALTEEQIEALWRRHPEPTLCFDGDKAGLRAAARAMDRAMPLLKPGKSLKFALVTGGKDPDDVLREQGPLVLREQLGQTRPFIDVLFQREAELEPLDTPERKAGLKKRLRACAAQIQDKDLAEAYRQDLLARYDRLVQPARDHRAPDEGRGRPRPQEGSFNRDGAFNRDGGRRFPRKGEVVLLPPTAEGLAAAQALSGTLDPLVAAVAQAAIDHPDWIDPYFETLESFGFGDPRLEPLSRALINLILVSDTLDTETIRRHLANTGFRVFLSEIAKAAIKSGAPFLAPDMILADARTRWTQAFDALTRLAALERAMVHAKNEAQARFDADSFSRLKTERDLLRRAIKTGLIWTDEGLAGPPGSPAPDSDRVDY